MKSLGILLLAIGVGIFAYFKAYPWVIAELGIVKKAPVVEAPVVVEAPPPPPPPPTPEPMPEPPKPAPLPPPPPAPVIANTGMGEVKPKVDADGFEIPIFAPIEELTKNWTAIPPSAFSKPREIKLKKSVTFEVVIGNNRLGSQVPVGGAAYVISPASGSNLVIAPNPESKARSQVNIDDTNLKEVLSAGYENWKVLRTATLKRAFMRQKNGPAIAAAAAKPGAPIDTAKPAKEADGTFKVLLSSMAAGDVTEVTPTAISKWEDPVQEEKDGKNYWVIVVTYTTKTMFGDFTTAAKAYVYNGKVEKWLYRDSGEVVP